jgi:hypothetical protein
MRLILFFDGRSAKRTLTPSIVTREDREVHSRAPGGNFHYPHDIASTRSAHHSGLLHTASRPVQI